jgi:hypothetical protein
VVARDGVVAPVTVAPAAFAFFLDVAQLSTCADLAVLSNNASARQRRESQKTNEAHTKLIIDGTQDRERTRSWKTSVSAA